MDVFCPAKGPVLELGHRDRDLLPAEHFAGIEGSRVLLVEDNEINQQVAREILQGVGLNVDVAGNGEQALQALAQGAYDAVLMDIQMPVMDGYEVFVTALASEGSEAKGRALGAADYITKPYKPDLVKARVQNHLQLRM